MPRIADTRLQQEVDALVFYADIDRAGGATLTGPPDHRLALRHSRAALVAARSCLVNDISR
jgi:hypothetical protein